MNTNTRLVFVLDVSGSMIDKIETLNIAVSSCISDITTGSYVGIVHFNSNSWIEHEVLKITDSTARTRLINKLPEEVTGYTNIGAGLIDGLNAFSNAGLQTDGAIIFLVTDGEHNCGPDYIEVSLEKIKTAKVKVNCIAYGDSADKKLERLTTETGGKIFKADDFNKEIALISIEAGIREIKFSNEICESKQIICFDDVIKIDSKNVVESVIIDDDIGRNTTFTIQSTDFEKFSVFILSPKNRKFDFSSPEYKKILSQKKYKFEIISADSGLWKINIITESKMTFNARVCVTSRSLNPKAIKIHCYPVNHDKNENLPPLIFVDLERYDVINQVDVIATIIKNEKVQVQLKLQVMHNIFWAYYADYSDLGRYNISVKVKSKENPGNYKFQRQEVVGCFNIDTVIPWNNSNLNKIDELIQTKLYKTKK